MSKSRKVRVDYEVDAATEWAIDELLRNHERMQAADEERFLSVMDKKPELHYGKDFLRDTIPTPPFTVAPFFPSGGLCLLYGKRGIGKTLLSMTLTRDVAVGRPFLGRFDTSQNAGPVIYVQLDMTDKVFQERLQLTQDTFNVDNWYVVTGVASVGRATQNTAWVQDVVAVQPSLIIIDTLRKAHSYNENDSDSAGRFYAKLRELFGWTSVMLIHHDKKDQPDAIGLSGAEKFRGSGAWLDDVDVGLHLTKKGKGLVLEFSKLRTCADIDPIPLMIDEANLTVMAPAPVAGSPMSENDRMRRLAELYREANPEADNSDVCAYLIAEGFNRGNSYRVAHSPRRTPY